MLTSAALAGCMLLHASSFSGAFLPHLCTKCRNDCYSRLASWLQQQTSTQTSLRTRTADAHTYLVTPTAPKPAFGPGCTPPGLLAG
jgi:hypothetical protein